MQLPCLLLPKLEFDFMDKTFLFVLWGFLKLCAFFHPHADVVSVVEFYNKRFCVADFWLWHQNALKNFFAFGNFYAVPDIHMHFLGCGLYLCRVVRKYTNRLFCGYLRIRALFLRQRRYPKFRPAFLRDKFLELAVGAVEPFRQLSFYNYKVVVASRTFLLRLFAME